MCEIKNPSFQVPKMDGNPANLRWFYVLEDILETEDDDQMKQKIRKCQDSLKKYPLVIHDLEHCMLLRHFDQRIVDKMTNRIKTEETALKPRENSSPKIHSDSDQSDDMEDNDIKKLARTLEEEDQKQKQQQEEDDHAMAMRLSQEMEEEMDQSLLLDYVPNPSSAFEMNDSIPKASIEESMKDKLKEEAEPNSDNSLDIEVKPPMTSKMSSISEEEEDDHALAMRLSQEMDQDDDDPFRAEDDLDSPKKVESKKSSNDQEDEDYALAIRLSQEMNDDEDFDYVPNPSSAFDLNESKPVKMQSNSSEEESTFEFKPQPSTSRKYSSSSENEETIEKQASPKDAKKKKKSLNDLLFGQDPIFNRLGKSSSEDEDENPPPICKKLKKPPKKRAKQTATHDDDNEGSLSNSSTKKKGRKYYPKPGSGASAILIALNEEEAKADYKGFMTKKELCAAAEPHADESMTMTRPGANQYYTGWSSSSLLSKKGYITMWSNPKKIKLTDSGRALAQEILEKKRQANQFFNSGFDDSASWLQNVDTPPKKDEKSESTESSSFQIHSLPTTWNIIERHETKSVQPDLTRMCDNDRLPDGTYDIILLVDKMEVAGGSTGGKASRKMITPEELTSLNVTFETRRLSIGDFVWIARSKIDRTELVLPYIIERKRMDDLRSSIMDGRYKEQKQRIQRTGIPNKIYLVEEIGHYKDVTSRPNNPFPKCLDRSALDQAMSNTLIRDGFHVKLTKNQKESMRFLAKLTTVIAKKYAFLSLSGLKTAFVSKVDDVRLPYFGDFHENSRPEKPLTVREIFCNMLICQRGLSAGMAWAITSKYPTLRCLKDAYENADVDKEKLLVGIPYDNGSKKIPLSVSKTLCYLFNDTELE